LLLLAGAVMRAQDLDDFDETNDIVMGVMLIIATLFFCLMFARVASRNGVRHFKSWNRRRRERNAAQYEAFAEQTAREAGMVDDEDGLTESGVDSADALPEDDDDDDADHDSDEEHRRVDSDEDDDDDEGDNDDNDDDLLERPGDLDVHDKDDDDADFDALSPRAANEWEDLTPRAGGDDGAANADGIVDSDDEDDDDSLTEDDDDELEDDSLSDN
jgi:hypothetical protein